MSTFNEADHPRGHVTNPGRFSEKQNSQPVGLMEEPDWGDLNIHEGSRTPWGQADHVDYIAQGIVAVGTPSHGGIKLSPQRNREIPEPLRNSNGWYEEDCEASIPIWRFAEEWSADRAKQNIPDDKYADPDYARADAADTIRNWYPDEWSAATGEEVTAKESSVLRERAKQADYDSWREAHADDFIIDNYGSVARDILHPWIPDGYRLVRTVRPSTGETKWVLSPKADTLTPDGHQINNRFVAQPGGHLDVTEIVEAGEKVPRPSSWFSPAKDAPVLRGEQVGWSFDHLTPAQQQRADKELSERWRWSDEDGNESVDTLGEIFQKKGVRGKTVNTVSGKKGLTYTVHYAQGNTIHNVSKATFDALTIPDLTTERDKGNNEYALAEQSYDRLHAKTRDIFRMSPRERDDAKRKLAEAEERLKRAEEAVKARRRINEAEADAYYANLEKATKEAWKRYQEKNGIHLD